MTDYIEELSWRGMLQDMIPGTDDFLKSGMQTGYIGFDPTADSLHVGSLATIMLLKFFQQAGHKPLVVVGGATGMIGDPSGKSAERNLLDEEAIRHNVAAVKKQLEKFLDFGTVANAAEIVNHNDWYNDMDMLHFLRDVGKHLTVNDMMSKESVKKRLDAGISFTEFSYQLLQAYDFYWRYTHKNCRMQMGGSEQWGTITSGTELIRRKGGETAAYGVVCPLVAKADGTKFGKTESGNIWLDARLTSPYKFYQFWINTSDEDASKYIRVFTMKSRAEIETLEKEHEAAPHVRALQKALAEDVTKRVHSAEALQHAIEASEILFGRSTQEALSSLSEDMLLDVMEGVPQFKLTKSKLEAGLSPIDLLTEAGVFASKGEVRRLLKEGGLSINKAKLSDADALIVRGHLLQDRYLLVQRGRKSYYLVVAE